MYPECKEFIEIPTCNYFKYNMCKSMFIVIRIYLDTEKTYKQTINKHMTAKTKLLHPSLLHPLHAKNQFIVL